MRALIWIILATFTRSVMALVTLLSTPQRKVAVRIRMCPGAVKLEILKLEIGDYGDDPYCEQRERKKSFLAQALPEEKRRNEHGEDHLAVGK